MSNDAPMSPLRQLAQAFAGIDSTEELIIFVAGRDNMLAFCRQLIEQFDRNPRDRLIREADSVCAAHGILPGALFSEVRKVVLALNRFHDAGRDHYGVLGLPAGASREEVKKAYRRLSKEYHPDGRGIAADEGQRFMEISGAYHALMVGFDREKNEQRLPWRKKRERDPVYSPHRSRNIFFGLMVALVAVLAGISVFLSAGYNRKAVISQFATNLPAKGRGDGAAALPGREKDAAADGAAVVLLPPAAEEPVPEELQPEAWVGPPANRQAEALPPAAAAAAPDKDDEAGQANRAPAADPDRMAQAVTPVPMEEPRPAVHAEPEAAAGQSLPTAATGPPAPAATTPADQTVAVKEPGPVTTRPPSPAVNRDRLTAAGAETGQPSRGQVVFPREESNLTPAESGGAGGAAAVGQAPAHDVAREINEFVNRYARRYNSRELAPFLALFADNATENGHSLAKMTEQYKSLFARTQTIRLAVLNLDWREKGDGFEASGDFEASYLYSDGRSREHNGEITFHIIHEQGEMKISALDYVFLK